MTKKIDLKKLTDVTEIGENHALHEDLSVSVRCSECKEINSYDKDTKQAQKMSKAFNTTERGKMASEWLCTDCWKKTQRVEKPPHPAEKSHDIQDNIRKGQSWNLAVAFCDRGDRQCVEKEQEYFYKQLNK